MSIIYDTKEIGRIARLRELDGRPQNEVTKSAETPVNYSHMVGEFYADYSALGSDQILAKDDALEALYTNSKPVEMPCDSNPQAADAEYFYGVGFTAPADDSTELYGADIGCLSA